MELNKFIEIKNFQKDIIKNSSTYFNKNNYKKKLFPIINNFIKIGEQEYDIEEILLDKIKLDENIKKNLLHEYEETYNKIDFIIKNKKEKINNLNKIIYELENNIDKLSKLKNNNAYKLLFAFDELYKSVIIFNTIFKDNITENNDTYCFNNGERYILSKEEYKNNIISSNYKAEIILNKSKYINYVFTEESYKTNETFKINFLYQGDNFKTIKEFIPSENKDIIVNNRCDKIIIEGFSLNSILNNFKVCAGKSNTNINRGIIVLEADVTKIKLQDKFILKSHEDIKCFSINKKEYKEFDNYTDFKLNYYKPENEIQNNKVSNIDLVDSYLILFIETDINILNKISMYGVD